MIVKERLYLTEDDEVVAEGHPDARWLFEAEGTEITAEAAERYGLTKAQKPTEPKPAAEKPAAKKAPAKKAAKKTK